MPLLRSSVVVLLVLASTQLVAQTVSGSIVDPSGLPLSGASISLSNASATATSGMTGAFSLSVPVGTYELTVIPPATAAGALLVPVRLFDVLVQVGANPLGSISLLLGVDVTGTVRLASGAAVNGGDIDVFDPVTGHKLYTPNDNTDVFGVFAIRLPVGTYDIRCEPLPGQSYVAQRVRGVQVAALPVSIGIVTLPLGVALSGTVISQSTGAPLAGIDIDVDDRATGLRVETPGDDTTATGAFSVIVPIGSFQVTFDPPAGVPYVSQRFAVVSVSAATSMGVVSLESGFVLTGSVVDAVGVAVAMADLDADMVLGGTRIFTTHDSTDVNGLFSITVPSGNYIINAAAPDGVLLASVDSAATLVNQATTLAAPIVLPPGHLLSGVVTTVGGAVIPGADVSIQDASTGNPYPVNGATADALGVYSTVVPAGTWDVVVTAPQFSMARDAVISGTVVSGPTTVDVQLSQVPMFVFTEFPVSVDPVVLAPGQALMLNAAFYNPNAFTSSALLDVEVIDPAGGVLSLASGVPFILPASGSLLALFVQLNLPPANPAHLGFQHTFVIKLRDPLTSAHVDISSFGFIRQ